MFVIDSVNIAYNPTLSNCINKGYTLNLYNMVEVNRIKHDNHITTPYRCFYPAIDNTTRNPYGISDEAVELMKRKPIGERPASIYVRTPVDGADYNGDILPISAMLTANSPQVEAMRKVPSFIGRKSIYDKLPVFTPYCVLSFDFTIRKYYPIAYTCLFDFDIRQCDNPDIDLMELKRELPNLPQIAYCGLATNGRDIFCVVPISAPKRHAEIANALRGLFRKQGITIRIDDFITHTRTISSDHEGYFNPNAVEFTRLW